MATQPSSEPLRCPKCSADMQQGWIPEAVTQATWSGLAMPRISRDCWVPGKPEVQADGYVKTNAETWETSLRIVSFRCSNCGYLESYALPDKLDKH